MPLNLPSPVATNASRIPLLQVVKTALAMVFAWGLSSILLAGDLPVFATIAALLIVQPSITQTLGRAFERSLGVIVGVLFAYATTLWFGTNEWIILTVTTISVFLAWALKFTPVTAAQIPISVMLVLVVGVADLNYAFNRIVETLLGAAVGIIVNIAIAPPVRIEPAQYAIIDFGEEIAATLDRLAVALKRPLSRQQREELLIESRLLKPMEIKAHVLLDEASETLTFHPRQSKHRVLLNQNKDLFTRMQLLSARTMGMTRAFHDHYEESLSTEDILSEIAEELRRAAHDLRLLTKGLSADEDEADQIGEPILTSPVVIIRPHPEHWILLGSLMEDLRRIRGEIKGENSSS